MAIFSDKSIKRRLNRSAPVSSKGYVLDAHSKPVKTNKYSSHERDIFHKMFSPEGLRLAQPYLAEEESIIKTLLRTKIKTNCSIL